MIYATWTEKKAAMVRYAMVVICPTDERKDSIDSQDTKWKCPECKKIWTIEELKRGKRNE